MKAVKFLAAIQAVLLLLLCSACTGDRRVLEVVSCDYDGLTKLQSGAFDTTAANQWHDAGQNPWGVYSCCLTEIDGRLIVQNRTDIYESAVMECTDGYFIGTDIAGDGWVWYYPHNSAVSDMQEEARLVVEENCKGFVKLTENKGYLFTQADDIGKTVTNIYYLRYLYDESRWTWTLMADINSCLYAYFFDFDGHCIYIAAKDGFYSFDLLTQTLSLIKKPELFEYIDVNSIVRINDSIYFGCSMGIYEYIPATDEEFWYPMDYEKYVCGK